MIVPFDFLQTWNGVGRFLVVTWSTGLLYLLILEGRSRIRQRVRGY